jgi:hypothetical protein
VRVGVHVRVMNVCMSVHGHMLAFVSAHVRVHFVQFHWISASRACAFDVCACVGNVCAAALCAHTRDTAGTCGIYSSARDYAGGRAGMFAFGAICRHLRMRCRRDVDEPHTQRGMGWPT